MSNDQADQKSKTKPIFPDRYYSLDEVVDLTGLSRRDLFHLAEKGELVIYVVANNWRNQEVFEIDDFLEEKRNQLKARLLDAVDNKDLSGSQELLRHEEIPNESSPSLSDEELNDLLRHILKNQSFIKSDSKKRVALNLPKELGLILCPPLNGYQPIAPYCFKEYSFRPETAGIEIDIKKSANSKDDLQSYLLPDPPVLLKEMIEQDALNILGADLKRLLGRSNGISLLDMQKDPRWPELLNLAVMAWLDACKELDGTETPKQYIEGWLRIWMKDEGKTLKNNALESIALVANWDKDPGRRPNKG